MRYVEHLPDAPDDDRQLPDLWFALYDQMIVFDHVQKTVIVLALADVRSKDEDSLQKAYRSAGQRIDALVSQLEKPADSLQLDDIELSGELNLDYKSNLTQSRV